MQRRVIENWTFSVKRIILNQIRTPDGTVLKSMNRHDFNCHTDNKTGKLYCVDGGNDYLKRSGDYEDCEEISIFDDAPFEIIRQNFHRGTRGMNLDEKLKYISLCEMSNQHLRACIDYNNGSGVNPNNFANQMYEKELLYRKERGMFIEDSE